MRLGLALSVQHRPEDSQAARFAEHLEQVRHGEMLRQIGVDQPSLQRPHQRVEAAPLTPIPDIYATDMLLIFGANPLVSLPLTTTRFSVKAPYV